MASLTHQPCPCGRSSDAYAYYSNGKEHCFSCGEHSYTKEEEEKEDTLDIRQENFTYQFIADRGVSAETYRRYNVRTKVLPDGAPHSRDYPYGKYSIKTRFLRVKSFKTDGPIASAGVFGKDVFPAGSARSITITEGEEDAMSTYQMLGSKYPAVSVQSSSSAKRDCTTDYDYINSFEKIYLCLDTDGPGQKATSEIQALFDPSKVYLVKLGKKDANEYLTGGDTEVFSRLWWNAKHYVPEGVISSYEEIDAVLLEDTSREAVSIPFKTLQEMTDGLRTSEYWIWTAREGTGKTELLRAVEAAALAGTDLDTNVATIHLEERKDRQIRGLAGLHLSVPCHLKSKPIPIDTIKEAYREITRKDNRLHIYSHYGSDDINTLLDVIRFLVVGAGCKFVFFDNFKVAVSGLRVDDEKKAIDYFVTQVAMMVHDLDFHFSAISHVNKEGETYGSTTISKLAHVWIHLERPIEHEVELVRNTTTLTIRKNRPIGSSGPAGKLVFNPETYTYREKDAHEELPT